MTNQEILTSVLFTLEKKLSDLYSNLTVEYIFVQVEYTEVDVKLANLTDDEISDDEIMRTTSRMSPVPTPMETEEQREVEEEEEEEDVPEGRFPMLCSTS